MKRLLIVPLLVFATNANADFNAGKAAYQKGDLSTAKIEFEKAGNDDRTQFALGFMYANGIGVNQELSQAHALYLRAANQGNASAQTHLARMYFQGLGIAQDYPQALRWYQASAEQGRGESQYNLGGMHEQGLGTEPDKVKAFAWLTLAANNNIQQANGYLVTLTAGMEISEMEAGQQLAADLYAKINEKSTGHRDPL